MNDINSPIKAEMNTSKGVINLELYAEHAPVTVSNFINLANRGYYDGLNFHRVISDFMVQGGCPQGSGTGGPGYQFEDECHSDMKHDRPGILSMANAGPSTNGSQFFITHIETPWLDGRHTVFGAILSTEDQAVVDAIRMGDSLDSVRISGGDSLLESHSERLAQWNKVLDAR
ncbi:MAG: peptidyl-prolyl cis-trans isomerase B (cyclophilin B) [Rhodothermales bacterium]|jgi:peptidyl-prolyl cis-trans isomerase B (cyclophilin B)